MLISSNFDEANRRQRREEKRKRDQIESSAPDLLKALELAYKTFASISNQWEGRNTNRGQFVLASMESAIKKATS